MAAAAQQPQWGDDENLWSRMLADVRSRSGGGLPNGTVLVLGEDGTGKSSLISRLHQNDEPRRGHGMEYHYLDVHPDYKDGSYAYQLGSELPELAPGESARLGVFVLGGDPSYSSLIKFALNPDQMEWTAVILCASLSEPWSILSSLQHWADVLQDYVNNCVADSTAKEAMQRQERFWQEYVEPLDSSSHSTGGAGGEGTKVPSMDPLDHAILPLGDGTLTVNLGLPIVVVLTKCDSVPVLEQEYDMRDDHLDFIQQHVRTFCLKYGAALAYTSSKDQRNCSTLYKYILHRVYGFPFTMPASVVDRDSVFIPAGWDNQKKVAILHENLRSIDPNDRFSDHIKKPPSVGLRRPFDRRPENEVKADDDQEFLNRLQTALAVEVKGGPISGAGNVPTANASSSGTGGESPLPARASRQSLGPGVGKKSTSRLSDAGGLVAPVSAAGAGMGGNVPGDPNNPGGSLVQEFFKNLLSSKTQPQTPGPANSGVSQAQRNGPYVGDAKTAEAELLRLAAKASQGRNSANVAAPLQQSQQQ